MCCGCRGQTARLHLPKGCNVKPVEVPTVEDAIEAVRVVCKRAPKPATLSNRLDFLQARDDRRLLGGDPGLLSASDIDHYIDECGGSLPHGELAYFLPRICTVLATGRPLLPAFGWDESFCFLRYSDFPDAWPDDRVAAMQKFCAALLVSFLRNPEAFSSGRDDPAPNIGTMLCAMMRHGVDAQILLDAVDTCDEALVSRALADWVECEGGDVTPDNVEPLFDHYWSMVAQRSIVARWLTRRLDGAGG